MSSAPPFCRKILFRQNARPEITAECSASPSCKVRCRQCRLRDCPPFFGDFLRAYPIQCLRACGRALLLKGNPSATAEAVAAHFAQAGVPASCEKAASRRTIYPHESSSVASQHLFLTLKWCIIIHVDLKSGRDALWSMQ